MLKAQGRPGGTAVELFALSVGNFSDITLALRESNWFIWYHSLYEMNGAEFAPSCPNVPKWIGTEMMALSQAAE